MARQVCTWVWEQDLTETPAEQAVLVCLANHYSLGSCTLTVEELATLTRFSRATVMRSIKALVARGVVVAKRNGRGNLYQIVAPELDSGCENEGCHSDTSQAERSHSDTLLPSSPNKDFKILRSKPKDSEISKTEKKPSVLDISARSANKPARKTSLPPAIQIARDIAHLTPPAKIRPYIETALGDEPDRELLERCWNEWAASGYRPTNWAWITDWYRQGGPPERQVRRRKPLSIWDQLHEEEHGEGTSQQAPDWGSHAEYSERLRAQI